MADNYDRGDAAAKLPDWLRERMEAGGAECAQGNSLIDETAREFWAMGAEACYRALLEAGPEWELSELEPVPHEHSHSLYVRCLDCQTFGINLPTPFAQAAECGNCQSVRTVKYYPACCMFAAAGWQHKQDRAALAARKAECEDLMFKRIQQAAEIGKLKAECERLREQRGMVVRAACKGADHEVELEAEVAQLREANKGILDRNVQLRLQRASQKVENVDEIIRENERARELLRDAGTREGQSQVQINLMKGSNDRLRNQIEDLEAEVARLRSANNFLELACKKALDGLPHGRRKGIVSDFLSKAREALRGGKP